jgi:translocation and assembly module TamA
MNLPARTAALVLAAALAACAGTPQTPNSAPGNAPVPAAAGVPAPAVGTAPAAAADGPATGEASDPVRRLLGSTPERPRHLVVQAPADLQVLLEKYLDLSRVDQLASGEPVDDNEWSRLIDAAPAQVRDLLQTEGYFAPQIHIVRDPGDTDDRRRVVLTLDPGPRTTVARLDLLVEGELERGNEAQDPLALETLKAWRQAWPLQVGRHFRNADWADAKANAVARLRAQGYASANWSGTSADIRADQHQARLFGVMDSGPLFRFDRLVVEGLVTHDLDTVEALANLPKGTPVTEQVLLDYQERLQKSSLFDSVAVTLDPTPDTAGQARILVKLREAPLQVWTFGLGISANTGPRASVEHVFRRVFGFAATARNKVELGQLKQVWDGELSSHTTSGLYRTLLGVSVERLESDSDIVLSQRVRLGRLQDSQRTERFFFAQVERSSRTTVGDNPVRNYTIATSGNFHAVWRRLDSVVLPTDGYSMSGQFAAGRSHGTESTSGYYGRLYGRFTGYTTLGRSWYLTGRAEAGYVPKAQSVAVPESQLFRAGGDDSVRGYSYRSLGPLVDGTVAGGEALFTGSVELARPISTRMPALWGAVFVDAGNAAADFQSLKPALGTGIGLRWRSPVGPLRLDWAYGHENRAGRLHFSVGITF